MKMSKSVLWSIAAMLWLSVTALVSWFIGDKLGKSVAEEILGSEEE